MSPVETGKIELWQLNAIYQHRLEQNERAEKEAASKGTSNRSRVQSTPRRNLIRERLDYAAGVGPRPEPDEPDENAQILFMSQAQQVRKG